MPALPQSAVGLLQLSDDPDIGPAEYAAVIEADAGLAGQVLRFVNSSYFGFAREISSVKLAITLVGVRTIKNFSLWSAVFSLMPNPKCGPFDLKRLWQDSLCRALFARELARLLGMSEVEEPFSIEFGASQAGETLDARFVGVLDAVVQDPGGDHVVLEHKTASRR